MNKEQTDGLLTLLTDLASGIKDLTGEVKGLVGRSRVRSIRTGYSDKVAFGTKDAILSVQLGRELPDDIDKAQWFAEYNNLKDATCKLVNMWEAELEKEVAEKAKE